ncbi:MAG: hypothetical protein Q9219_005250 [cf. Caloplaca sp. 3 TL-2023]
MCGIYFAYNDVSVSEPSTDVAERLFCRGPDYFGCVPVQCSSGPLLFAASVLSLRGTQVVEQPLRDPASGSILCWNGEAWKIHDRAIEGNDAEAVLKLLLQAVGLEDSSAPLINSMAVGHAIVQALSCISGPYAFIFYHAKSGNIFYGRDLLGRRSLLKRKGQAGSITLSSVRNGSSAGAWIEVEADGIHAIHLPSFSNEESTVAERLLPWPDMDKLKYPKSTISLHFGLEVPRLKLTSPAVDALLHHLQSSLENRVLDIPETPLQTVGAAKVAVLFSGGLDCTLLARVMHDLLPKDLEVDLLNAAFENPRVIKAASTSNLAPATPYCQCPDRVTGLSSYAELQRICPDRTWRFVSIDIPYSETVAHRPVITSLIYPHNTEMDLSIASALYFAARGSGTVFSGISSHPVPYATPARVLLSGIGADELFAGYTRHATAFSRGGYQGLWNELELDYQRIGKRNLGRDDRVISHWGREVRYPYLDEDFLHWALRLPLWAKYGYEQPLTSSMASSHGDDEPFLESSKKLLRLLIWKLGMKSAAKEKKRAIQFGARTAKMEAGKRKGTELIP